jgi:translation elongation factor EF-4
MHVRVWAFLLPKSIVRDSLSAGEVGFVIAGIKDLESTKGW